jgi:hypothetical protein
VTIKLLIKDYARHVEQQNKQVPLTKREQNTVENRRLWLFWKAKQEAPRFTAISKRSAKNGISGYHKGVYMSQRGDSKFGKLQEDVPFPE